MSCSTSRWRGWRTAGRAAAYKVGPAHAGDRGPPPATPAMAQMQSRQPPSRLPSQESDISRFGNPLSEQRFISRRRCCSPDSLTLPVSVEQPCLAPHLRELCSLLATGLVRLRSRTAEE